MKICFRMFSGHVEVWDGAIQEDWVKLFASFTTPQPGVVWLTISGSSTGLVLRRDRIESMWNETTA